MRGKIKKKLKHLNFFKLSEQQENILLRKHIMTEVLAWFLFELFKQSELKISLSPLSNLKPKQS